ncbi:hypothetical protein GOBAR_DD33180 [Gossypium barbadense]|nr:hypothetical protein GOBAR_DD33180 [Gossypium barbadense]
MMKPQLQFLYWKWFHFVGRICSKEGKDREGEYRRNTGETPAVRGNNFLTIYSNLRSSNGHTRYVRVAFDRNSIYRKEMPDKCDVVELILSACDMANMRLHYSFWTLEAAGKERQWATSSLERPLQSSSTNNHRNSFSSLSSSRPSSKQKSFMEMMKSAQYNDFEEDEDFILKKESSTTTRSKGELRVKVDGKSAANQKANTSRSKHSATEQRRRSKINDRQQFFCRFQRLRGIIPNSDQKRDKASFLLEVIEYIQFLQEKVHKHERAYQGWNHEPSKLMPWLLSMTDHRPNLKQRNNETPAENHADQSRAINSMSTPSALVFSVAPNIPGTAMNPVDSDMSTATTLRPVDLGPAMMNKTMPFAVSPQPNSITSAQSTPLLPSDAETNGVNLCYLDLNVSRRHGLLNTLTQALQASGVDLSHASLSVQIELGKQSSIGYTAPTSTLKGCFHCLCRLFPLMLSGLTCWIWGREIPSTIQGATHLSVGFVDDSDRPIKKLKT